MNRVSLICLLDINVGCKFEKREKKKKTARNITTYIIHFNLDLHMNIV